MTLKRNITAKKLACFLFSISVCMNASATDRSAEMDAIAAKLKAGDFSPVTTTLTELAKSGDDRAQFNLAVSYAHGNGVAKNDAEAAKWYQSAALQGNKRASFNLASSYMYGTGVQKNINEAIKWYEYGARMNDTASFIALGNIYSRGLDGVQQDAGKAFGYYSSAAKLGSEEAEFNLAGMYLFGAGVEKSPAKALEIYNKLASHGNASSAMIIAEVYESGQFVQQDLPRAYAWYDAQYQASRSIEAKRRADILKNRLKPDQLKQAKNIGSSIILAGY